MKLTIETNNLFNVDKKYALVHCISQDCEMSEGIARQFNDLYPEMKSSIKEYCYVYPSCIPYLYAPEDRVIFNLVTKKLSWNKPTYKDFESSLIMLLKECKRKNIKYLAMPMIGCGKDRLQWNIVRRIIEKVFSNTDIEILIVKRK